MPATITSMTLLADLVTKGLTGPSGLGGHLAIQIAANHWIGAVSAAAGQSTLQCYETSDLFATVAQRASLANDAGTLMSAFERNGTTVIVGGRNDTLAPNRAIVVRSTNTGGSYAAGFNFAQSDIRAYAMPKLSSGAGDWFAGLGQTSSRWFTSTDDAVNFTNVAAFDAARAVLFAALEIVGFGTGRMLVGVCDDFAFGTFGNKRIYTADAYAAGPNTLRQSLATVMGGTGAQWPIRFFQASSGTCFAVMPITGSGNAIWRSTDGGVTWTQIASTPNAHGQMSEINGTLCVPRLTSQVYYSLDDGLTWTSFSGGAPVGFVIQAGADDRFYEFGQDNQASVHPVVYQSNVINPAGVPLAPALFNCGHPIAHSPCRTTER
jgi:hypothetical protein